MKKVALWISVCAVVASSLSAAAGLAAPTSAAATAAAAQAPASDHPVARDLRWRNIGPANMTGRIAAVEALSTDHRHVLVASASGGVFKSTNAGITWDAIFDNSDGAGSIGAVAMFEPDPDIIPAETDFSEDGAPGIIDVRSGSEKTSLDGEPYGEW